MPNPLAAIDALLSADADNFPDGTTRSAAFPSGRIDNFHVQFGWDGSPSDADNREDATIRVTVWGPYGRVTDTQDLAEGIRARLVLGSSDDVWRVTRGAGRLAGVDPDTDLPFCSFTVTFAMHALAG